MPVVSRTFLLCSYLHILFVCNSPSAGSPGDSRSSPLLTQPIARLLGRGLKVTNRRHSSGPADELPFGCVDCDERWVWIKIKAYSTHCIDSGDWKVL